MKQTLKKISLSLILSLAFFGAGAYAAEPVSDASTLTNTYFKNGGDIILEADITLTANAFVRKDLTLDLNGHTINMSGKTLVPYEATLTVKDTSENSDGKLTSSGKPAIQVGTSTKTGDLILESGILESTATNGYVINNYGNLTINGGLVKGLAYGINNFSNIVLNGGEVRGDSFVVVNQKDFEMNGGTVYITGGGPGVYVGSDSNETTFVMNDGLIIVAGDAGSKSNVGVNCGKPFSYFEMNGGRIESLFEDAKNGGTAITGFEDSTIVINDGEIIGYSGALMGNGSFHDWGNSGERANFTINGGTLTATNGIGIYSPQPYGATTITGGTITGYQTGVEVRAGDLTISGGVIKSEYGSYEAINNTNGSTTYGAAISVAQHTTKQPINVLVSGGSFEAPAPISFTNPLEYSQEILDTVHITITGGDYNSTVTEAIFNGIVDNVEPITGGTYSNSVAGFIADGYGEYKKDNKYHVGVTHTIVVSEGSADYIVTLPSAAVFGETVEFDIPDREDYIKTVSVKDSADAAVAIEDNHFTMPDDDVTVSVSWQFVYRILSGADQTVGSTGPTDIVVTSNGDLNKLVSIKVDGDILPAECYELESGSTILTLAADYLSSLAVGEHLLTFVYRDGSVSTNFTVEKAPEPAPDPVEPEPEPEEPEDDIVVPNTGSLNNSDGSELGTDNLVSFILAIICGVATIFVVGLRLLKYKE